MSSLNTSSASSKPENIKDFVKAIDISINVECIFKNEQKLKLFNELLDKINQKNCEKNSSEINDQS